MFSFYLLKLLKKKICVGKQSVNVLNVCKMSLKWFCYIISIFFCSDIDLCSKKLQWAEQFNGGLEGENTHCHEPALELGMQDINLPGIYLFHPSGIVAYPAAFTSSWRQVVCTVILSLWFFNNLNCINLSSDRNIFSITF